MSAYGKCLLLAGCCRPSFPKAVVLEYIGSGNYNSIPKLSPLFHGTTMALLNDSLSVWEIAFRWSGRDPHRVWLFLPLEVQDCFRNLMDAILSADLPCESITLEKREFGEDEKEFSVYFWLDDIYACIWGHRFNRKLFRHASIERYDFKLWCERRNIPLPEFWFPPGWNLEYELPEDDIRPGHYYVRKHWTPEDLANWKTQQSAEGDSESADPVSLPTEEDISATRAESKELEAVKKLRPNQEAAIACKQIAKAIWKDDPTRTIASVIKDELIQKYGGAAPFVSETVREWIKSVAPENVRNRRGRPPKNGG